ncbi:MAG: prepilin-type N-terminal cleavage/methylation domain-containing protein [Sedimentisphaerales bacterium]|nr:prepilin-type N-terminal cleavage/methylation domain-containing protein [Sedimentisphaerales bacterium]
MKKYDEKRRGFTLAEAMMAVVVLSIAAAGVLLPFSSGAVVRAEGVRKTLSAKLASDLIEVIVNTPFDQITNFEGYSESQGHIVRDFDTGEEFANPLYENFSRSVSCVNVDVPVSPTAFSQDIGFVLVTVQVRYNGRQVASISRLVSE